MNMDADKMIFPTLSEAKEILSGGNYTRIPVGMEVSSDMITPIMALRKLKAASHHVFMLESAEANKEWGRYTFLGYDPIQEITCINGNVNIKSGRDTRPDDCTETSAWAGHPGTIIRELISANRAPKVKGMPPFSGGFVGYFSYDYIKYSEPTLKLNAKDEEAFKDVDLMLFDKIIAFDNVRQKLMIICNIKAKDIENNYIECLTALDEIRNILMTGEMAENKPLKLKSDFRYLFDKEQYCQIVEKGKYHIHEGDIFQIVLSNRMDADIEGSLFDTYRILRMENPSPYMFYFSSDDVEIAGASPETLVKLEDGVLHTFPLAGTRPRGKTAEEDERLERELLADEKERAEHNMLVDLGRNDIGKISRIGSVEVEHYMDILRYSHVMHIGSTVKGIIRDDKDALDAVDSILPAGTLSGAPKLKACQLINDLEDNKRGIYGGAIGYIDFTGNLDTCIAIRLAFSKNGKVFVRSGAGIVADSVPENEYNECINKAAAVIKALKEAEGGIDG